MLSRPHHAAAQNRARNLVFSKTLGLAALFVWKETDHNGKNPSGHLGGSISMSPFGLAAKLAEPASEHPSSPLKPFFSNLDASTTSHHLISTRISQHFSTICVLGSPEKAVSENTRFPPRKKPIFGFFMGFWWIFTGFEFFQN